MSITDWALVIGGIYLGLAVFSFLIYGRFSRWTLKAALLWPLDLWFILRYVWAHFRE